MPSGSLPSERVSRLLFDYEVLDRDAMIALCEPLPKKVIRWLGINHPDNRTRKLFYELTGVPMGPDVYFNAGLVLYDDYKGLVRFGARVATAHNVTVVASQGPNNSRIASIPYVRDQLIKAEPVTIEDDAWLGTGSIILPGVTVGRGAVVAAGAVVTRDVAPYTIVAGTPAKAVRQLDSSGA
jgi:acetyltransferase-like isoleucine patch superfamily enzyme